MDFPKESTALIVKDFELESTNEALSEEELLDLLAERMAYLIDHRMEFLLSMMYRMDVSEAKVNFALSPFAPDPPHYGLARLVLERHKQRIFTKKHFHSKPPENSTDGWEW